MKTSHILLFTLNGMIISKLTDAFWLYNGGVATWDGKLFDVAFYAIILVAIVMYESRNS